jgi:hypothetical protein
MAPGTAGGLLMALLLVAWLHGCQTGKRIDADAHAAAAAEHAATIDHLSQLTRTAADKARAASADVARDSTAADEALEAKTDEATRLADDLARALRTGDRQLQDWWACPVPGPGAGDAAADRAEAHAAQRADSTGRIVEAADHDAAVIDWLWARWQADRAAVVAAGCAVVAP